MSVPVLVITGPVGAGKTTVAYEVSLKLRAADVAHVVIDDEFGLFFPRPENDATGDKLRNEALRSLWMTYAAAGVPRVVLARALEGAESVAAVEAAIPDAEVRIFALSAALDTLYDRIDQKGVPSAREWCRERARELLASPVGALPESETVHTDGRSPPDVAAEIVRRSGWL